MIAEFEDFCLWVYVIIDDLWKEIAPRFGRPGRAPACSDSELIAMVLIGECQGWDEETELLGHFARHRDLFPRLPTQSRFNRRRRALWQAVELLRRMILERLDLAQDRQCVLDSLPVPVVGFHLAPGCGGDWAEHGAAFGRIASKKQTIHGYRLHLLVTFGGVIRDLTLAPANVADLTVAEEMLSEHRDLTVIGDKAYIGAAVAQDLRERNGIVLLAKPRRNQRRQLPPGVGQLWNRLRQIVETVNGQLATQLHIETNHAHTFWGLRTRLLAKLTAHTLCIYINRLLDDPHPLQIKKLAFAN